MKNTRIAILLLMVFTLLSAPAIQAQKKGKAFKGIVTYEISYPNTEIQPAMMAQLPKQIKTKILGNKTRVDMNLGMMQQARISDGESGIATTLLDLMGQKFAIKQTREELEKERGEQSKPTIEYKNETKEIAGYKCQKVEIITGEGDDEVIAIAYVTDKIQSSAFQMDNQFEGLNGLLMEYDMNQNNLNMHFVATDVKKGGVSKKDFEVPETYKEVTQDELQQMFGGGM